MTTSPPTADSPSLHSATAANGRPKVLAARRSAHRPAGEAVPRGLALLAREPPGGHRIYCFRRMNPLTRGLVEIRIP